MNRQQIGQLVLELLEEQKSELERIVFAAAEEHAEDLRFDLEQIAHAGVEEHQFENAQFVRETVEEIVADRFGNSSELDELEEQRLALGRAHRDLELTKLKLEFALRRERDVALRCGDGHAS